MLAEIFMMRLEATARMSPEAASAGNSRFVPVSPAGPLESKKGASNLDADVFVNAANQERPRL